MSLIHNLISTFQKDVVSVLGVASWLQSCLSDGAADVEDKFLSELHKLITELTCTIAEGRIIMTVHLKREDDDALFQLMTKENTAKTQTRFPYDKTMSPLITKLIVDASNMLPIK